MHFETLALAHLIDMYTVSSSRSTLLIGSIVVIMGGNNDWLPNNDILITLCNTLDNGSSNDNNIQQEVIRTLNELSNTLGPDEMSRYLAVIFATNKQSTFTRQRAGLLLKNIISTNNIIIIDTIKRAILETSRDNDSGVRSTACTLIASILSKNGINSWPECMVTLSNGLNDISLDVVDGSFKALKYVCEDGIELYRKELLNNKELNNNNILSSFIQFANNDLIPKLLQVCTTSTAPDKYKALSLNIIHLFVCSFLFMPGATILDHYMVSYFNILGTLAANSKDPAVLKEVCIGFVHCANHQPDLVEAHLPQVLEFMLTQSSSLSNEVRREALEFWPAVCLNTNWLSNINTPQCLNIILPTLLSNMIYAKEDFESMESGLVGDDSHIKDEQHDMAPIFHQDKSAHNGNNNEDDEDDDSGDEEDRAVGGIGSSSQQQSTWGNEWTVRKAAANALDNIASALHDDILPILLPLIEKGLTNTSDWKEQEASVLAVGAIAHGCDKGLSKDINTLLPLLIQTTLSNQPLLRSIGCWTLGRFGRWLSSIDDITLLKSSTTAILERCLDKNKRVQEAAISSLAGLIEDCGNRIKDDNELLDRIIKVFNICIRFYQYKNFLILLDAIGTLISSVGSNILSNISSMGNELIPTILERLNIINNDNDKCIISLLEALTPVLWSPELASKLGEQGVRNIVNRCGRIINAYLNYIQQQENGSGDNNGGEDIYDADIVASALDCLSAIAEGLHATEILNDIIVLIIRLIQSTTLNTRIIIPSQITQALYALLGDLSKYCSILIIPHLNMILPSTIHYIDNGGYSTCNNAIWALGEIFVALATQGNNKDNNIIFDIKPYGNIIGDKLVSILETCNSIQRPLLMQNAAISFGRLALVCPNEIGNNILSKALIPWCTIASQMRNDIEKAHAIHGICLALQSNPSCGMAVDKLSGILLVSSSLYPPPPPPSEQANDIMYNTIDMCNQLVHGYKSALNNDDWDKLWNTMIPNDIKYKLNILYNIQQ